jgi:hypothetical protein
MTFTAMNTSNLKQSQKFFPELLVELHGSSFIDSNEVEKLSGKYEPRYKTCIQ